MNQRHPTTMDKQTPRLYYLALLLAVIIHGCTIPFTFEGTYDALVHLFFADHYAGSWFDTWEPRWYTGFTVTSYPPLVHQVIALLSYVVGLKGGFIVWSIFISVMFVRGIYEFTRIWTHEQAAAFAALAAVFSSSFTEALHIFGQLPSLTGATFLLNACPELYKWIRYNKWFYLISGLSLLAVTTTAHHVTTIFGMVFFVLPTAGHAVMARLEDHGIDIKLSSFIREVWKLRVKAAILGVVVIGMTGFLIFPYWYWSKTDPIAQVPIPHGSRDSFINEPSLGLIFFLIPWGAILFILPYIFKVTLRKTHIFLGLSLAFLFLLGTGGTTPLPRMILGSTAYDILTLDRFTFWSSLLATPFVGLFFYELVDGDFKNHLRSKFGTHFQRMLAAGLGFAFVALTAVLINFQNLKTLQPEKVDIDPIVSFLNQDNHDDWRYLTLGFGDQMAWLSANTNALTIDGNYHSARRLPELTTRAVERLENAKYLGYDGLQSLQQFLTNPETYAFKYIFANDKFYDPLLFFAGWQRVQQLDNDIVVWEKPDVPRLPGVLGRKSIPTYQRIMWGVIPITVLLCCLIIQLFVRVRYNFSTIKHPISYGPQPGKLWWNLSLLWGAGLGILVCGLTAFKSYTSSDQYSPQNVIEAYFHRLDFKYFEEAHDLLSPQSKPSFETYMKGLSADGGILSSYAKLDSLHISYGAQTKHTIDARVSTFWSTALQSYKNEYDIQVSNDNGKWYVEPFKISNATPPDPYIRTPNISFRNQGRRRTTDTKTDRRDVLDRPDIDVLNTALVVKDSSYYIIGELINTDAFPAYITVNGKLYDEFGQITLETNVRETMKHVLLPNERTCFRIDFDDVMVTQGLESLPNIDQYGIHILSVATDRPGYKSMAIQRASGKEERLEVINVGTNHISVPQFLFGHVENENLLWVDIDYASEGIRPNRSKQISPPTLKRNEILEISAPNIITVNGRLKESKNNIRRTFNSKNYNVFIDLNAFMGNDDE